MTTASAGPGPRAGPPRSQRSLADSDGNHAEGRAADKAAKNQDRPGYGGRQRAAPRPERQRNCHFFWAGWPAAPLRAFEARSRTSRRLHHAHHDR